jgi:hypothetical protein
MSRYTIPAQDPALTVVVGWDNPLVTFFAQAFDPSVEDEAEADLLWIGTAFQEIPTVAALQAQLTGWAIIPPAIADCLTRDQQAATPPTPSRTTCRPGYKICAGKCVPSNACCSDNECATRYRPNKRNRAGNWKGVGSK